MTRSLVVLAGGKSRRFGRSKQLEPVGPNTETLLEYSIYDALRNGFGRAVIVTSPDNREALQRSLQHLRSQIELLFVVQEKPAALRRKPLGTAHALLSAAEYLDGPFAVVNADDFYGASAFQKAATFLAQDRDNDVGLLAYKLSNTIRNENPASRALCVSNDEGRLLALTELTVTRHGNAEFVARDAAEAIHQLSGNERISMNFWLMPPGILAKLAQAFESFLMDKEFALPDVLQSLSASRSTVVRLVIEEGETFGLSYPSDRDGVVENLARLHEQGYYPTPLWESLA